MYLQTGGHIGKCLGEKTGEHENQKDWLSIKNRGKSHVCIAIKSNRYNGIVMYRKYRANGLRDNASIRLYCI